MKLLRYIITGLMLTVLILLVVQIGASNMLTTSGIDLGQMQQKLAEIKKENILLSEKVYTQSSLTHIASEAATLGFVPEKTVAYIKTTKAIAIR